MSQLDILNEKVTLLTESCVDVTSVHFHYSAIND